VRPEGRSSEVGVCWVHVENVRDLFPHGAHPDLLPMMAVEVRSRDGIRFVCR